jgi:hypothetical protein
MRLIEEVPMQDIESNSSNLLRFNGLWLRLGCAGLIFAAAFGCVAQDGQPAATSASRATAQVANSSPQKKTRDNMQQGLLAGDSSRKKQLADESTELLAMALALKAEVDKTTKDTLSLNVIKKADQIEKLAKSVKEKMKQSSGS